jgi:hypothetical protein
VSGGVNLKYMSTPLTTGFHYGIPAKAYHSDPCSVPSLSSGIARTLLNESPAHAHLAHPKLGGAGKERTDSMGLGSLVHSLMDDNPEKDWELGVFDNYKGGEARLWRDGVTASGKLPVLERDLTEARPVVESLRRKVAAYPDEKCEVTAIWKEGEVWCRARYDRLRIANGTALFRDWKTSSNDMSDRGLIRSITKYGYHIQVAFYLRGLAACMGVSVPTLSSRIASLGHELIFVQTAAPYTVRRVKMTDLFLERGNRDCEKAIKTWGECLASGDWSDPREAEVFEADLPLYMEDVEIEIG